MSRIISLLKRAAAWSRVMLTMIVASGLLLTTACSPTSAATTDSPLSPKSAGEPSENAGTSMFTDTYGENQSYKGGMNRYSDTDPRRDTAGVAAKSKGLVDSAERNIEKVQDVDDFVDNYKAGTPLGERIKNIGENAADKAENIAEDVNSPNVPRDRIRDIGTENAEEILDNTTKSAKRAARDAQTSAKRAGRDATQSVKNAADKVGDAASDAAKSAKRGAEDAVDAVTR